MEVIEFLNQTDQQLMLTLNGLNAPWLDQIWYMISYPLTWIPLYCTILVAALHKYRFTRRMLGVILLFAFAVIISNHICSEILKPWVGRLRPSNLDSDICSMIHIVNGYRGGRFSFPSSHACNSFAVMLSVALVFRNRLATSAFVFWAVIHSYSRIYLGVHYPGDILVGTIIGLIVTYLVYLVVNHYFHLHSDERLIGSRYNASQYNYELPMPVAIFTTVVAVIIISLFQ